MAQEQQAEGKRAKSDLARAFSEDGELKTHVGGQALIEGIMMRGKLNWAVAVREPDGNMYVEEHDLPVAKNPDSWLRKPFVRGCTALVESLALGYKALDIAAEHAFEDEEEDEGAGADAGEAAAVQVAAVQDDSVQADVLPADSTPASEAAAKSAAPGKKASDAKAADKAAKADSQPDAGGTGAIMTVSMVFGLVLGIALFILLPAFLANVIVGEYDNHTLLWNIVDGVLRVAVFIGYIWLIGRMEDIKRMFMYHGAEHKTIHCYEHGLPLTPENARSFPRLHVRCGTAFLIMVMIIAIIVYTIIPVKALITALGVPAGPLKFLLVVAIRIIFMPVIAGISYEITEKWAGTHPDNPLVKVILWPGMQMQYLTTNEPDDSMLECAIAAMQLVLEREEAAAAETAADAVTGSASSAPAERAAASVGAPAA